MFLLGLKAPEEMVTPALAHPSQGPADLQRVSAHQWIYGIIFAYQRRCLQRPLDLPAQPAPICAGLQLCPAVCVCTATALG